MNVTAIELARHFLEDVPAEAANKLESLPAPESAAFLNHVPAKITARLLLCLSPGAAAAILLHMEAEVARDVLALLNPNQIASLLRSFDLHQQTNYLKLLPENRAHGCQKLLLFPQNCVGAHVITEVPVFSNTLTIEECIARIKTQNFLEADTVFINNTENQYLGAVKLSALLHLPGKTRIDKLPRINTFQLSGLTPLNTAFGLDLWLQEEVIAVVDAKHYFVGSLSHRILRRTIKFHSQSSATSTPLLAELGSAFTASMLGLLNEFNRTPS